MNIIKDYKIAISGVKKYKFWSKLEKNPEIPLRVYSEKYHLLDAVDEYNCQMIKNSKSGSSFESFNTSIGAIYTNNGCILFIYDNIPYKLELTISYADDINDIDDDPDATKTMIFPTLPDFSINDEDGKSYNIYLYHIPFSFYDNYDGGAGLGALMPKHIVNVEENNTVALEDMDIEPSNANKYISWDSYFMGIALMARSRSKDPVTQVGACIVKNNRILSTGYNGFPTGCNDNEFPWGKGNDSKYDNKYYYVVHAELNAILNCKVPIDNATLYVTMFPCNECIKAIIQAGIKKIIFYEADKKYLTPGSEKMLKAAKIETIKYKKINKEIKLEL